MIPPRLRKPGITILSLAAFGSYAAPAFAYLDPGTGSMLLQGLIGAIAAAALTVKLYWHKFKSIFRSKGTSEKPAVEPSSRSGEDE